MARPVDTEETLSRAASAFPLYFSCLLDCSANFVEQNPYETRNTNLISLDVATKL